MSWVWNLLSLVMGVLMFAKGAKAVKDGKITFNSRYVRKDVTYKGGLAAIFTFLLLVVGLVLIIISLISLKQLFP